MSKEVGRNFTDENWIAKALAKAPQARSEEDRLGDLLMSRTITLVGVNAIEGKELHLADIVSIAIWDAQELERRRNDVPSSDRRAKS